MTIRLADGQLLPERRKGRCKSNEALDNLTPGWPIFYCQTCKVPFNAKPSDGEYQEDGSFKPHWEILYCLQCALYGEPWDRFFGGRKRLTNPSGW